MKLNLTEIRAYTAAILMARAAYATHPFERHSDCVAALRADGIIAPARKRAKYQQAYRDRKKAAK